MEKQEEIREDGIRELARALSLCDSEELMYEFLHSILTEREVQEIATRWMLVRRIEEGDSQRNISKELNLSLCKITRGSRELKKENSAFRRMIDIIKELDQE